MKLKNRWMSVVREIRLGELMKLIPDDEIVMIIDEKDVREGCQEEAALFNGEVLDWWKEAATTTDMAGLRVMGFRAVELADTVGPVTMIVTDF